MNGYLEYLSSVRRYSPRTLEIYRGVLEEYSEFLKLPPGSPIGREELGVQSVRAYEVFLLDSKKNDARTVNLHLSVLSGYCKYLVRRGELDTNPLRLVSRPKQGKRLPEFFREEDMEAYFRSTAGVPEYGSYEDKLSRMVISLLYGTGIRRSELISLDRNSIDWHRKTLRVRGKGDKTREIPLTDTLCEEISLYLQSLDSLKEGKDPGSEPLLQTKGGARLYPMLVERIVRSELSSGTRITSRKSPHVLRHTLATELMGNGADMNAIKELLGHSSLAATQVYTHNSIERLKSVYNNAHPRAKNGGKNGNQD
ncbi:MAG: tyrosine-type recombinase/integrase [Bacteroidales bacterium]|nr:tyrosine-type recombinase/integrase [Bacteroidales bacterium]